MCPVEGHITDVQYSHSGKSRKLIKFTTSHKAAVGYTVEENNVLSTGRTEYNR